jgi:hypothetical protein
MMLPFASRYHYRSAPNTPDPFPYMLNSADSRRRATLAYVAPFLAFIGIMAVERMIPLPPQGDALSLYAGAADNNTAPTPN